MWFDLRGGGAGGGFPVGRYHRDDENRRAYGDAKISGCIRAMRPMVKLYRSS